MGKEKFDERLPNPSSVYAIYEDEKARILGNIS